MIKKYIYLTFFLCLLNQICVSASLFDDDSTGTLTEPQTKIRFRLNPKVFDEDRLVDVGGGYNVSLLFLTEKEKKVLWRAEVGFRPDVDHIIASDDFKAKAGTAVKFASASAGAAAGAELGAMIDLSMVGATFGLGTILGGIVGAVAGSIGGKKANTTLEKHGVWDEAVRHFSGVTTGAPSKIFMDFEIRDPDVTKIINKTYHAKAVGGATATTPILEQSLKARFGKDFEPLAGEGTFVRRTRMPTADKYHPLPYFYTPALDKLESHNTIDLFEWTLPSRASMTLDDLIAHISSTTVMHRKKERRASFGSRIASMDTFSDFPLYCAHGCTSDGTSLNSSLFALKLLEKMGLISSAGMEIMAPYLTGAKRASPKGLVKRVFKNSAAFSSPLIRYEAIRKIYPSALKWEAEMAHGRKL